MRLPSPRGHGRRVANQTRNEHRPLPPGSARGHLQTCGPSDGAPIAVVPVVGEVDGLTGTEWEALIRAELTNRPGCLIIDLSRVEFVGSTALAIFSRASMRASARHRARVRRYRPRGRPAAAADAGLERLFVLDA
jgi:hypothetical protein